MILGLIINLMFPVLLYGQFKVTYNVTYKPDKLVNKIQNEEMVLNISGENSYFYNYTKEKLDSAYDAVTKTYLESGIAPEISTRYDLNFGIYKDRINNRQYFFHDINNTNFYYEDALAKINWVIEEGEKKEILGYQCMKATCFIGQKKWISWFSKDIPIQDGPYKFHGLPGLILQINDENCGYTFTAVGLEKDKAVVDIEKISGIKITKTKYEKLVSDVLKDPAIFVRQIASKNGNSNIVVKDTNGNVQSQNDVFQRIVEEFASFRNSHTNPIEKNFHWIK